MPSGRDGARDADSRGRSRRRLPGRVMGPVGALVGGALGSLGSVSPWLLGLALVLHLAKMTAEARAWHGIVRHAHEGSPVPFRTTLGAFVGSIGANALLPARVGEAFRIGVLRRHAAGSSVAAMTGTVALETAFEAVFAAVVVGAVFLAGRPLGLSGTLLHPPVAGQTVLAVLGAVALVGALLVLRFRRRAFGALRGMAKGFAVLREPRAVGRVAAWKAVAWGLRTASVFSFLVAFGLPASLWTAVLVLAAQNAAAALPILPGNAGTQQAALVVALAGTAGASRALGFGVGMQAATVLADLALGAVAVVSVAGGGDLRAAVSTLARRPRLRAAR